MFGKFRTYPWQRLVNRVGFGVLYHAAHHRNARNFNPAPVLGVPERGS